VTRFRNNKMPPSASRLMAQHDRRDQMILGMAQDAARVKSKAREARRKRVRQTGYRKVRYQRFQGRCEEALEEETRGAYRARLGRSIQAMAGWLESQARASAEEGQPRSGRLEDADGLEDVPLSRLVAKVPEVVAIPVAFIVEGPLSPWEPVMRATLVGRAPLTVAVATLVSAGLPMVKGGGPTVGGGQSLITSFFTRG
jgi:hypothetical protein